MTATAMKAYRDDPEPNGPVAPSQSDAGVSPAQTEEVLQVVTRGAPLGIAVQLTVPGTQYIFEGIIEHFFGGEASILLDHHFQKETLVRIEFHGFQFDGEVQFSERKGNSYDTHVV